MLHRNHALTRALQSKMEQLKQLKESHYEELAEMESSATEQENQVKLFGSFKVIDAVVDAYASNSTNALVWVCFVCHSGAYASLILLTDSFQTECPEKTFGCTLGKTV